MFAYAVVTAIAIICLGPFLLTIISSFTNEQDLVINGYSFLPKSLSLAAYKLLLSSSTLSDSYEASLFITCVGSVLSLAVTTSLAYVIGNPRSRVGRALGFYVYIPMIFYGGLVPFYVLVTQYLHLSNSWWAVILPLLVNPFNVLVLVSFFRQFPMEVLESAIMDGANELVILVRIVVPLSAPAIATIALFIAVAYWNDWFMALLFITNQNKFPLQLLLQNMISTVDGAQVFAGASDSNVPGYSARMALTVLTSGPILVIYPFLQRYFVKGLALGAVKG